ISNRTLLSPGMCLASVECDTDLMAEISRILHTALVAVSHCSGKLRSRRPTNMRRLSLVTMLAATVALVVTLSAQTLDVQLQRAVQKEIATGDYRAAIDEYKRIDDRAGQNRSGAAAALLRL